MAGAESKNNSAAGSSLEPVGQAIALPARDHRYIRYFVIIFLVGAVVFCWLSLLTYNAADPPSPAVYPPLSNPSNAAGLVGAYVAYYLRYWFGVGAYMGLLFASVATVIMILGSRVRDVWWRLTGVVLLATATAAGAYLKNPTADVLTADAGIIGTAVGAFMLDRFASTGAWLMIMLVFGVGLMLSADNLVLNLPRFGKKVWSWRRKISLGKSQSAKSDKTAKSARSATSVSDKTETPRPKVAEVIKKLKKKPSPPPSTKPAEKEQPSTAPSLASKNADRSDKDFTPPSSAHLIEPSSGYIESQEAQAEEKHAVLQKTLDDFGVDAQVLGFMTGPVITLFEVALAPGVKVSRVSNLAHDIARALAVPGVRVVSPLPGRDTIGVEVPNMEKEIVRLKELMNTDSRADKKYALPLYLGKDAGGEPIVADLASMPHMLIAGTTGSGKSVCLNSIIMALLMTRKPADVRFILVDPKMVEMNCFESMPHLMCPIVNDLQRAENILEWAAIKMDQRYNLFRQARVRNIGEYNRTKPEELYKRLNAETKEQKDQIQTRLPYVVIIIDELADLIMTSGKEVENHIIRISQKARAVGIHMILATQRPSVNVVTGLIKSNMPSRISFRVASRQESRIVLDQNGAEVLLGRGDMLFLKPGTSNLVRAQGTYVDESEIHGVVDELRSRGKPQYNEELMNIATRKPGSDAAQEKDELFDKAVEIVLTTQRGSVSLLQRRLQIGYSRASRIIDQMAEAGILGEYKGSQARECMMTLEDWQSLQESIEADQSGTSSADGEPTSV